MIPWLMCLTMKSTGTDWQLLSLSCQYQLFLFIDLQKFTLHISHINNNILFKIQKNKKNNTVNFLCKHSHLYIIIIRIGLSPAYEQHYTSKRVHCLSMRQANTTTIIIKVSEPMYKPYMQIGITKVLLKRNIWLIWKQQKHNWSYLHYWSILRYSILHL